MIIGNNIVLQIILGVLYSNLIEWISHRYVLHYLGKKKNNIFSFHWYGHHKMCRTSKNKDVSYNKKWWKYEPRKLEVINLFLIIISQVWILWYYPVFYIVCVLWTFLYYYVHKKCHQDIDWGKKWMPWHYDHHMGSNQDLNWCVVFPIWDYIFGTRKKYFYDKNGRRIS